MANPVVSNILKSNAVLWTAPEGEPLPDPSDVAAGAAWGGNWERVGYTKEALSLALSREYTDIVVEEILGKVDKFAISEEAMAETVLAEPIADYLQLLLSGTVSESAATADEVGYETLEIGNDVLVEKRAWGFEAIRYDEDENALPVRVFLPRAAAIINGELQFSKHEDDYTGLAIQLDALADPDNDGHTVIWERTTAPATGAS